MPVIKYIIDPDYRSAIENSCPVTGSPTDWDFELAASHALGRHCGNRVVGEVQDWTAALGAWSARQVSWSRYVPTEKRDMSKLRAIGNNVFFDI